MSKGDASRVQDIKAYKECPLWKNLEKAKHDVCRAVTDENSIKMLDLPKNPPDFKEFCKTHLGISTRKYQDPLIRDLDKQNGKARS